MFKHQASAGSTNLGGLEPLRSGPLLQEGVVCWADLGAYTLVLPPPSVCVLGPESKQPATPAIAASGHACHHVVLTTADCILKIMNPESLSSSSNFFSGIWENQEENW